MIKIDDLYAMQNQSVDAVLGPILNFLGGLSLLSLDACEPFYKNLILPSSFGKNVKICLQQALRNFNMKDINTSDKNAKRESLVTDCFRHVEEKISPVSALDLGLWIGASHDYSIKPIEDDLRNLIRAIEGNKIRVSLLNRLDRFSVLRELMESRFDSPWDEALEPENLSSSWDKKHYAAHFDPDPEEEHNSWSPDAAAYMRADRMYSRIAWENACKDSPPDATELEEINAWVESNKKKLGYYSSTPCNVAALFLDPRLRARYEKDGVIQSLIKP